MDISVIRQNGQVVFKIEGGVDESGAEALNNRFNELDLASLETVIFDFSQVNHIGSAGIGKLLLFHKHLTANGGTLQIRHVAAPIQELFSLLKLNTIFNVSPHRA